MFFRRMARMRLGRHFRKKLRRAQVLLMTIDAYKELVPR